MTSAKTSSPNRSCSQVLGVWIPAWFFGGGKQFKPKQQEPVGAGDAERGHVAGRSPHQSLVLQTPSFPVSLRPHQEHQVEGLSEPLGPEPRETGAQRECDPGGGGPCSAVHVELPRLPGGNLTLKSRLLGWRLSSMISSRSGSKPCDQGGWWGGVALLQ